MATWSEPNGEVLDDYLALLHGLTPANPEPLPVSPLPDDWNEEEEDADLWAARSRLGSVMAWGMALLVVALVVVQAVRWVSPAEAAPLPPAISIGDAASYDPSGLPPGATLFEDGSYRGCLPGGICNRP